MARALRVLAEADRPIEIAELAKRVYVAVESPPAPLVEQLAAAVESDHRIDREGGQVSLAAWQMRHVSLAHAEFVALDVESNGGASGRHRVIELAAVRFGADGVRGRYATLVSCPAPIARAVTRMTGITPEMLDGYPSPDRAVGELADFCLGAVLVAHNLPSDLNFLNQEAHWAGLPPFPHDGLDTAEIAAIQYPQDAPYGLARTLSIYGIAPREVHRAGSDAEAVRLIFLQQIEKATADGMGTVGSLRDAYVLRRGDDRRLARLIAQAAAGLPALPGVYRLLAANGEVLYVGMARSLQRRVRSHLTNTNRRRRRRDGLLELVDHIEYDVLGSELAAAIAEQEQISAHDPFFNRQKRSRVGTHFVALVDRDGHGQLRAQGHPRKGARALAGPFRTSADARDMAGGLRRALSIPPTWRASSAPPGIALDAAAEMLNFGAGAARRALKRSTGEDAARFLRRLNRRPRWPRPLPAGRSGGRVLAVTHAVEPGTMAIWLIADSQIVQKRELPTGDEIQLAGAVDELTAIGPVEGLPSDESVSHRIDNWLIANADSADVVWLDRDPDAVLARVLRAARRLWN